MRDVAEHRSDDSSVRDSDWEELAGNRPKNFQNTVGTGHLIQRLASSARTTQQSILHS